MLRTSILLLIAREPVASIFDSLKRGPLSSSPPRLSRLEHFCLVPDRLPVRTVYGREVLVYVPSSWQVQLRWRMYIRHTINQSERSISHTHGPLLVVDPTRSSPILKLYLVPSPSRISHRYTCVKVCLRNGVR
jgi:hypothetical protein